MYHHSRVNTHTTTHNPFNDKHPSTRSSNNQDTPTAQHQHPPSHHHKHPTPTHNTDHPRQRYQLTHDDNPDEHRPHNRAHPNNHAAADNRSRRQQTQERRRTAQERPHPSWTIARKRPTTQTDAQNKPAGQDRGNGGNNRVKNVKSRGLGWFNHWKNVKSRGLGWFNPSENQNRRGLGWFNRSKNLCRRGLGWFNPSENGDNRGIGWFNHPENPNIDTPKPHPNPQNAKTQVKWGDTEGLTDCEKSTHENQEKPHPGQKTAPSGKTPGQEGGHGGFNRLEKKKPEIPK